MVGAQLAALSASSQVPSLAKLLWRWATRHVARGRLRAQARGGRKRRYKDKTKVAQNLLDHPAFILQVQALFGVARQRCGQVFACFLVGLPVATSMRVRASSDQALMQL